MGKANVPLIMALFIAFLKNTLFITGSALEVYFEITTYFFLVVAVLSLLPNFSALEKKVSFRHQMLIIISFIYCAFFDKGHIQLFMLILVVLLVKINNSIDFFRPLAKIYFVFLALILFAHVTRIYTFPSSDYNTYKGVSVQLGFRNINTYGIYCYSIIIIFYLFNEKKWFWAAIAMLLLSTVYSKTRSPVVGVSLIIIFELLSRTKLKKHSLNVLILWFTLFIFAFGFLVSFYANELIGLKQVFSTKIDLNEASSSRLQIFKNVMPESYSFAWFFGGVPDAITDSFYVYFLTFFGIIGTPLICWNLLQAFFAVGRNINLKLVIVVSSILLLGLFEMPISPFLPISVILFLITIYPTWDKLVIPDTSKKKRRIKIWA